jgi:hypothetical protein
MSNDLDIALGCLRAASRAADDYAQRAHSGRLTAGQVIEARTTLRHLLVALTDLRDSLPPTVAPSIERDEDTGNPDRCPSCGAHYTDHLGLIGTCTRLGAMTDERDRLYADLVAAREELGRVRERTGRLEHEASVRRFKDKRGKR